MQESSLSHEHGALNESALAREQAVTIRGDGVAAYCCAYLLQDAGFRINLQPVDRPRLPVILLGVQALALIRDIFKQPDLFVGERQIRTRIVRWGADAQPATLEHSAVIVSEQSLLDAIRPRLKPADPIGESWTILANRPLPAPATEHSFGSRMASAVPVKLRDSSDQAACWIESLRDGWLFLTPEWLLAVGAPAEALLGNSRTVADQIASAGPAIGEFPAFARISSPLCAPQWLACGTAAMAFDPICGDGTAHAIREAILASAVIRAVAGGGPPDDLCSHYEARLTAAFQRHLLLCQEFYASGGTGPLWSSELHAIDRGIEWCAAALAGYPRFRYRLRGLELEAVR